MDFSGRIIVLAEISNKQLSSLRNSLTGLEFENRDNDTINYCEHLLRTFLILNDPQRPFLISDPRNIVCNKNYNLISYQHSMACSLLLASS